VVHVGDREFIIVGTAHISRESADLVREVVEKEQPDCVCVELDDQRFEGLSQKKKFQELDIKQVIRKKQLALVFANQLLASYQKKLGGQLGVMPGTELIEATVVAQENGIPIRLCDRDVRVTLRRAWASMGFFNKLKLTSNLAVSAFERPEITEDDLRRLRDNDVMSELMRELGEALPELKVALIDERDAYLSQKMLEAPGDRVVAVVGAGHVSGICKALTSGREVDLEEIEKVPPVSNTWKWVGWGIPTLVLASLFYIGFSKGVDEATENLLFWIVVNSVPCTLGAIIAMGHPLTVLAGFLAAPITSLTPVVGAGYVCAFVQAFMRPPKVRELETMADEISSLRAWWSNKMLRILLVFILTTLGSVIGTWVGGFEIASNLF
jgi:pheromone shutdown-related protein TraB